MGVSPGSGTRALLWGLALGVCAASVAHAAPVYLGSAARAGVADEDHAAIDAVLIRALKRQGIPVVDASAATEDSAARAREAAREALDDATAAYSDEDWKGVLTSTEKAFVAFEKGPAFSDDAKDVALGRDILALRALAALSAKKKDVAQDSMRRLLVIQPKYAPNKKKAPKALLRLVEDMKDELASFPPSQIEIKSKPVGARVVVDGRRRGKTPMLIEDLSPGVHYVLLDAPDGRHTERIELGEDGAAVNARLGNKRRASAKEVLALVEKPVGAKRLVETASDAGQDVVVAVFLPSGKNVEVIAGRIADGEVKSVLGVTFGVLENDRETAAFVLAEGIREQRKDTWLDKDSTRDPDDLRGQLFSGTGTTRIVEEDGGLSPAVIAVGIIGGIVVVGALGTAAAVFAVRESKKDQGFTWSVDAGRL